MSNQSNHAKTITKFVLGSRLAALGVLTGAMGAVFGR